MLLLRHPTQWEPMAFFDPLNDGKGARDRTQSVSDLVAPRILAPLRLARGWHWAAFHGFLVLQDSDAGRDGAPD